MNPSMFGSTQNTDFASAFDDLHAAGYEAFAFDANEHRLQPREDIRGGRVFDNPEKIAVLSIRVKNLVIVTGPRLIGQAYHIAGQVGNFSLSTPCFVNDLTAQRTWALRRSQNLPVGAFQVEAYAIRVYDAKSEERLVVPPTAGVLRWIEPPRSTQPAPLPPIWVEHAIRGIS